MGAAALFAPGVLAQPSPRIPVVGLWTWQEGALGVPGTSKASPYLQRIEKTLASARIFAGRNARLEYRFTNPDTVDQMESQALELLSKNPDVIWARFPRAVNAIRAQDASTPVVFDNFHESTAADAVGGDVRRPPRNVTGVALNYFGFAIKRLDLVRQLLPRARRVAIIADYERAGETIAQLDETAHRLGLEIVRGDVAGHGGGAGASSAEATKGLEMTLAEVLGKRPDALMAYGAFNAPMRIRKLLDFELKHRIPYIDDGATARSTVGFGMDYEDHLRRAASIIAEILKGKPVADIPVDFTSRYLLRVNLKRAREIGIEIPASILLRADTIER